MGRSLFRWLFAVVALGVFLSPAGCADSFAQSVRTQGDRLVFGIFPFLSPQSLEKRFSPLARHLSDKLGRQVVIRSAADYTDFLNRLNERPYDIVYFAPHLSLLAVDSGRYEIVARVSEWLSAQIVVRDGSPIKKLPDLDGATIATPPKEAFLTPFGIRHIAGRGVPFKKSPEYVTMRSHNAAYKAALSGDVDAAIVSVNVVNRALKQGAPLKVIEETNKAPAPPILVATDLPAGLKEAIVKTLVSMRQTEEGRAVLARIVYPGYVRAQNAEYETLRPYLDFSSRKGHE